MRKFSIFIMALAAYVPSAFSFRVSHDTTSSVEDQIKILEYAVSLRNTYASPDPNHESKRYYTIKGDELSLFEGSDQLYQDNIEFISEFNKYVISAHERNVDPYRDLEKIKNEIRRLKAGPQNPLESSGAQTEVSYVEENASSKPPKNRHTQAPNSGFVSDFNSRIIDTTPSEQRPQSRELKFKRNPSAALYWNAIGGN